MRITPVLTTILLCSVLGANCEETRTFRFRNSSIEAELIDATAELVTLKTKNPKRGQKEREFKQSVSQFSEADQAYFREWRRLNKGEHEWPALFGRASDRSTEEVLGLENPKVIWRASVGEGDAAVVAADGKAFTAGIKDGKFLTTALNTTSGAQIWEKGYPVREGVGRASSTPTIDLRDSRVITLGPGGRIDCLNAKDGSNVWATPLPAVYAESESPAGGQHPSPIIDDANLLVEVGGPAHSLVAFSKGNGQEIWGIGRHQSRGAVPILTEMGESEVVISRNVYGLVGRDPASGDMKWDAVWESSGKCSAVAVGEGLVFVTSKDKCAVFRITGRRSELLWENTVLCSDAVTPVFYKGYLYGFNANGMACVDVTNGKGAWSSAKIGAGKLIRAADRLLVQTATTGELVVVAASAKGFQEQARIKVFDGASNTIPVFASGLIYCRSAAGEVTCLDARAE